MLSSCTPSEVVRTLRYVFFGCFCYQSSCLLIYLGTGVFIQMLGHENNSKHVVLPRSTPYLDLVHGPPSADSVFRHQVHAGYDKLLTHSSWASA